MRLGDKVEKVLFTKQNKLQVYNLTSSKQHYTMHFGRLLRETLQNPPPRENKVNLQVKTRNQFKHSNKIRVTLNRKQRKGRKDCSSSSRFIWVFFPFLFLFYFIRPHFIPFDRDHPSFQRVFKKKN